MKSQLIAILETICPGNVFLQGTLNENEAYPESFITFWCNSAETDGAYNNADYAFLWHFSVNYYSSDPVNMVSVPASIRTALKNGGFIPQGKGSDIPSDKITHTGWTVEVIFKEFV